jgi:hypothetical protein
MNDFQENIMMENDKKVEDFIGRLHEERRNAQIRQEKLAFGISRISPTALFKLVSSTLCGTSIDLKSHFYKNAVSYSKSFAGFIKSKTAGASPQTIFPLEGQNNRKPPQPIDPGEIPEFIYQAPELSTLLYDALPDIAILFFFNLIFFWSSFLAFLRFDLR